MTLDIPENFIPHNFLDELEREGVIKIYVDKHKLTPRKSTGNVLLMEDVEAVLYELISRYRKE